MKLELEVHKFTFMIRQEYLNKHYVEFTGSFEEAREKMHSYFGSMWAFQYSIECLETNIWDITKLNMPDCKLEDL